MDIHEPLTRAVLESKLAFEIVPFVPHRTLVSVAVALGCLSLSGAAIADGLSFDLFKATHLIGVSQDSSLSNLAKTLGSGGFETSGGSKVNFAKWYSAAWVDTRLDFMTQVTPHWGVLWGLSTGEQGEKYTIEPSFKVGFLSVYPVSKSSKWSFSATTIIGGRFQERSCTADYGDIGGTQEVNCRMAATEMEPAQTLAYLTSRDPANKYYVSVQYTLSF